MKTWLLVGLGGALGAVARHELTHVVAGRFPGTFPLGTLMVNVTGAIVIGLLAGLIASARLEWSEPVRTLVFVGMLGGFTTFSAFSLDTFTLLRSGQLATAMLNIGGQVGLSLAGVWAGFVAGSWR